MRTKYNKNDVILLVQAFSNAKAFGIKINHDLILNKQVEAGLVDISNLYSDSIEQFPFGNRNYPKTALCSISRSDSSTDIDTDKIQNK